MKTDAYKLPLTPGLRCEIEQTARVCGLSMVDAIRLGLKLGLPEVRTQFARDKGRVVTVEPWAKGELAGDYASKDDEGYPIRELAAAQRWPGGED